MTEKGYKLVPVESIPEWPPRGFPYDQVVADFLASGSAISEVDWSAAYPEKSPKQMQSGFNTYFSDPYRNGYELRTKVRASKRGDHIYLVRREEK